MDRYEAKEKAIEPMEREFWVVVSKAHRYNASEASAKNHPATTNSIRENNSGDEDDVEEEEDAAAFITWSPDSRHHKRVETKLQMGNVCTATAIAMELESQNNEIRNSSP